MDGFAVALDEVWGREAVRIRERLGGAACWEDRFALVGALLAHRQRAAGPAVDPEVSRSWERMVGSGGLVRVEELAAETGWSRRRLWGRFRAQIGLPPKRAARLVRFHRAARRLASGGAVSLIAAECGFTDQSHLHREVLAFTGLAPTALAGAPGLKADTMAWPGHAAGERHPRP
ncbi:helix-turn-helix domain-containing protein [Streptomyces sp. NPDC058045]|uniref:helix-turn-helix domain-containing protein n=1 Tax=Streptomyces sp. NPDC058045 TaxID=3346311 RepID=UPI0036E39D31